MLADEFDGYLFDLDGVIYLGPTVVPTAPETMAALRERDARIGFVTNNAGRSPEQMAERITGMGIRCDAADLVTSAQAIVAELAKAVPAGSRVLVVGSAFLADELDRAGLRATRSADDEPVAVIQGWGAEIDQQLLAEGCFALSRGIPWYVSNTDLTIPTDRGIGPGSGSFVKLISGVTKREPDVIAGKPHPPLLRAALERLGAESPVFVGDRLDTDVEGAKALGIASLWVMTGAHGKHDLLAAPEERRPDHIAADLAGLLREPYVAERSAGTVTCGDAVARAVNGRVELETGSDPVAALWALAQLVWAQPDLDHADAEESLPLH